MNNIIYMSKMIKLYAISLKLKLT